MGEKRGFGEISEALKGVRDVPRSLVQPRAFVWLLVQIAGSATAFTSLNNGNPPTLPHIAIRVAGLAIFLVGSIALLSRSRDRAGLLFTFVISAMYVTFTANDIAKVHAATGTRVLATAALFVCIVPTLVLVSIWHRIQDELQRSVLSGAAVIAIVGTIVAGVGYWILGHAVVVPTLSPLWVVGFAGGMWAVAWIALYRSVS